MSASVTQLPPKPQPPILRMLRESIVEHRALQIAQVCGERVTALDELRPSVQHRYRAAALLALEFRTYSDAEGFARDQYAQAVHGRTFNCLEPLDQARVYELVRQVTQAIALYMDGDVQPMTAWLRRQVECGAQASRVDD